MSRECPEEMERTFLLDERLRAPERRHGNNRYHGKPEYMHKSGMPLRKVIALLEQRDRKQLPLFDLDGFREECEGHCGI